MLCSITLLFILFKKVLGIAVYTRLFIYMLSLIIDYATVDILTREPRICSGTIFEGLRSYSRKNVKAGTF